jgi:hypothetical protein
MFVDSVITTASYESGWNIRMAVWALIDMGGRKPIPDAARTAGHSSKCKDPIAKVRPGRPNTDGARYAEDFPVR